jgi:hypothetical protein
MRGAWDVDGLLKGSMWRRQELRGVGSLERPVEPIKAAKQTARHRLSAANNMA